MRSPESVGGDSLHERRYRTRVFGSRAELQGGKSMKELVVLWLSSSSSLLFTLVLLFRWWWNW